ncbi:MAG TPA: hypothetical protein VHN78_16725, partial [Chloroflexota bacterium]|nr:hypothetical protein [Chloroflexota bacterium]
LIESDVTRAKGLFWLDAERIAGPIYKALEATGRTRLPKVEDFVDFSVLQDAYGGKTKLT